MRLSGENRVIKLSTTEIKAKQVQTNIADSKQISEKSSSMIKIATSKSYSEFRFRTMKLLNADKDIAGNPQDFSNLGGMEASQEGF